MRANLSESPWATSMDPGESWRARSIGILITVLRHLSLLPLLLLKTESRPLDSTTSLASVTLIMPGTPANAALSAPPAALRSPRPLSVTAVMPTPLPSIALSPSPSP